MKHFFSFNHSKLGSSCMFPGGEAIARKRLNAHPDTDIRECSIYRDGRWVKTIKRPAVPSDRKETER